MNVPLTKTWIDRNLSRKERKILVDYLLERTTAPTGEQILEAIGELFPNKTPPKIRSVNDWKAKAWKFELYLRRLETDNAEAKLISEASGDIADANKKMVDGYVFNELQKLRNGELESLDPKIHAWIAAASQLARRSIDDKKLIADLEKSKAQIEILKSKLAEYEAREAERRTAKERSLKELKTDAGLSEEALARIETILGSL
ncbi:MAG: hypothetical protein IKS15_04605 [Opitutales bacterium]|nr:hypothetical protein [Opitutales bacterium]